MQVPSPAMSQDTDGEAAGVVIPSTHDDHPEHGHGTIIRNMATGTEDEDQKHGGGGGHESFFQCLDEDDDDGDGDDARFSFATAVGDDDVDVEEEEEEDTSRYDYVTWMEMDSEPVSIQERRRRLLQGMGLASSRDLLRSRKARPPATAMALATVRLPPDLPRCAPPPPRRHQHQHHQPSAADAPSTTSPAPPPPPVAATRAAALTRSRSDSRLAVRGGGARKPPAPPLRRARSLPHSLHAPPGYAAADARCILPSAAASKDGGGGGGIGSAASDNGRGGVGCVVTTKDREFAANGGVPLGTAPLVKQFMRRSQSQPVPAAAGKGQGGETKPAEKKRTRWLKNIKLVATAAGLRNDKDKDAGGGGGGRSARAPAMSKSASAHAAVPSSSSSSSSAAAPERLKVHVHHYGKSGRELTGVYMRQEVRAHEGSIWTIKFSPDGRFLASGGEDHVVRVWAVVAGAAAPEVSASSAASTLPPQHPPPAAAAPGLAAQLSRRMRRGRSGKDALPEHVVVPETAFALAERPACAFEGHQDDVLDLSWSKSQQLLSSSMDKTVRLWDMDTKTCLKMFPHNDYVTCVQFNPADDGYFISGSLDCKVRIWSVPDRQVVDWSDVSDMVTAACYTPDGQAAIIGSHKGSCRFYKTTDCKLNQEAQIDMSISKKRKSQAKKITGFQFAPGNPSEILVTSADSQIRVFNGITVLQKFKGNPCFFLPGFKNTSSQISASYTADGRYVVCASEDSNVYVWRRVPNGGGIGGGNGGGIAGGGGAGGIGVRAKTWLTSRSYEYFFCRDVSVAVPWPGSPAAFQQQRDAPAPASRSGMPGKQGGAGDGDDDGGVPRRHKSGPMGYPGVQLPQPPELSRRQSSARWHGGAEGGNAWGMVVVTASRGGEIRVYQNFGLPLGNLFH
ncbi:unnamed protein product [Urochloa humidicola]